jgi:hypothetical protein
VGEAASEVKGTAPIGLIEVELPRGGRVRISRACRAGVGEGGVAGAGAAMIPVPAGVRVWLATGVHVMRIPRGEIELKLLAGRRERLIHSSCRRHEPPGAGSATKDGESRHELLGLREHRTHELAGCR